MLKNYKMMNDEACSLSTIIVIACRHDDLDLYL